MNKTPCFKLKRNLSPLDHLGDFAVWNISWRKIQSVVNISSGHTCQTDSDPKRKTGKKPNLRNLGEKNSVEQTLRK